MTVDFEVHGPGAILKLREENPAGYYVRMVASLLPKKVRWRS